MLEWPQLVVRLSGGNSQKKRRTLKAKSILRKVHYDGWQQKKAEREVAAHVFPSLLDSTEYINEGGPDRSASQ